MPDKIYYDRDRQHYLNLAREYYNNNREYILKEARNKYNDSEEDKNKRIEYGKSRYHNMSPEKKFELKAYQKEYQRIYREKKKREHANFNENAVLTP